MRAIKETASRLEKYFMNFVATRKLHEKAVLAHVLPPCPEEACGI